MTASSSPSPLTDDLTPLPVDLDALADVLDAPDDALGARIDLRTGVIEPDPDDFFTEPDDGDWLEVYPEGTSDAFADMTAFAREVEDEGLAQRLDQALDGGAERFAEVVAGTAVASQWAAFRVERRRARALSWLEESGYTVRPRG